MVDGPTKESISTFGLSENKQEGERIIYDPEVDDFSPELDWERYTWIERKIPAEDLDIIHKLIDDYLVKKYGNSSEVG